LARRFARDDWGGTETVILETSKRLLNMGHHTEVQCTLATAESDSEEFEGVLVRRHPYFYPYVGLGEQAKRLLDKKGGSPFSFGLMRALKRLPELDLIHLHVGNRIGGIGRHVARQRRIPYVVSLHGGVFDVPAEEVASWAEPTRGALDCGKVLSWWVGTRRVLLDASAILCVGYRETILAQKRLPDKPVIHLPNGADTERFASGDGPGFRQKYGIPLDSRVLLTLARIDSQKNQHLPARLIRELREIDPRTHLLFVGHVTNPAYHEKLEALVVANGMENHVTVIPGIAADSSDLVNAYHAADLFLLPSVHEPFGIVILEAWSAGLPVIASRVGGIPHFVSDGEDGLLFDPADERELLAAYRALTTEPALCKRLGAAGQKKAREEYDWNMITRKLVRIYEDVIRENNGR